MESTMNLTVGFKGAASVNGLPVFNHDGAPLTTGGIIDPDNTEVAYFGRAVSEDVSSAPHQYMMGKPSNYTTVGVLQNDYAINENSPAKPDYLIAGEPATVIMYGCFWLESWTHAGTGTVTTPYRGCVVIFKNTTGQIEFLPILTAIPSGYTILNARVLDYNANTNKVLLFIGVSDVVSEAGSTPDVLENTTLELLNSGAAIPGFALSGAFTHGIDFSAMTVSTNTDGTLVSTGSNWIVHATAGQAAFKLLCSTTATTGDYATLRIRARGDAAWTGGATGGVVAGNFSSSANINDYGNLIAVQGYAQPNAFTQASESNIICGLYSCIDRSGSSVGRSWSLWTDTHETVKASGGHYLHRLSHNGGAFNLDGVWSIYQGQGIDYLFNFENNNSPVVARDSDGGTATYSLKVYINGAVRYIQCYDAT